MGQRIILVLLLLFLLASNTSAVDGSSISRAGEKSAIYFDEQNAIGIPQASLIDRNSNRAFPFHTLAMYEENQTISGAFQGPSTLAGTEVRVTIASFNISKFMSFLNNNGTRQEGNGSLIRLNASGDASFSLAGLPDGVYIISMTDEHNSTLLSASPLLVTIGELSIDAPRNLPAGDPISMTIKTPGGKEDKIYAAIMISKQDYDSAKLEISTNNTSQGLLTSIFLGNESRQIQGLPAVSSQFLMGMLPILPQNSAIAMQESNESEAKLVLITDNTWQKGSYILTSAVYAPGKGILGLKQTAVEVT
jgi:methanogen extracellular protein (TIGR04279 family)